MDELTPVVDQEFDSNSPQHLLWQKQMKYNRLKRKQQMRWHPLIIRFALNLLYSPRAAYHAVTSSGFLSLPSERTLRDYSHWCKVGHGVNFDFIKEAQIVLQQGLNISESEQLFVLLLDEMKIKSGLVFNKNSGELVGFSNLGEVNEDIDKIVSRIKDDSPYTPLLAKKMLAFMVRPVHKPSLAFTIAAYPTTDISGSQLFPIAWEVIEALELNKINFQF